MGGWGCREGGGAIERASDGVSKRGLACTDTSEHHPRTPQDSPYKKPYVPKAERLAPTVIQDSPAPAVTLTSLRGGVGGGGGGGGGFVATIGAADTPVRSMMQDSHAPPINLASLKQSGQDEFVRKTNTVRFAGSKDRYI